MNGKVNATLEFLATLFEAIEENGQEVKEVVVCPEDAEYLKREYGEADGMDLWGARVVVKPQATDVTVYGSGDALWVKGPRLVDFKTLVKG